MLDATDFGAYPIGAHPIRFSNPIISVGCMVAGRLGIVENPQPDIYFGLLYRPLYLANVILGKAGVVGENLIELRGQGLLEVFVHLGVGEIFVSA
jgi:hypothetical protein